MKKVFSLGLGLAMAASLTVPALAANEDIMLISAPIPDTYNAVITVNGKTLDTSAIPFAGGIPMRLVAENDYGSASWYAEENSSYLYFEGNMLNISYATNIVTIDETVIANAEVAVLDGVTFMSPKVFEQMEGYTIKTTEAGYDITTPNGAPMVALAREISDAVDIGLGMRQTPAELEEYHGIAADNFTDVVAFLPMMISPDTVVVAKLADGKADTAKAQFEAYRQKQIESFTWYLSQNLPKVENAVFHVNGDYMLFIIGGQYADKNDPDYVAPENPVTAAKGVELFDAWVAEQSK